MKSIADQQKNTEKPRQKQSSKQFHAHPQLPGKEGEGTQDKALPILAAR
jgi:hypothetical protein